MTRDGGRRTVSVGIKGKGNVLHAPVGQFLLELVASILNPLACSLNIVLDTPESAYFLFFRSFFFFKKKKKTGTCQHIQH